MKEYPWTKTFGPMKYGTPSGKLMVRAVSDRGSDTITKENWFFMTGTLWRDGHLHTDRCAKRCTGCKCED